MSVDISFKGQLKFVSQQALNETIKETIGFIENVHEDESTLGIWKKSHTVNDLSIVINLNTGCSYNEFYTYEGAIEILVENAIEGKVEGWRDDYEDDWIEIYEVGLDDDNE